MGSINRFYLNLNNAVDIIGVKNVYGLDLNPTERKGQNENNSHLNILC